jgi:hypothetical protein
VLDACTAGGMLCSLFPSAGAVRLVAACYAQAAVCTVLVRLRTVRGDRVRAWFVTMPRGEGNRDGMLLRSKFNRAHG